MPSETEISLILSQMDKTRHLMPQSSNSNPQQGQQQQQHNQQPHYPQHQQQLQFHHLPQMPPSSYDNHQHHLQNNHPGFPPMPQSDIPVASTSSGHPHPQLIQQQQGQGQGQGQQQNDPNNSNSTTSPQHPPLPPLPPNVSPGRSRASRAAKSAAQIMAGLQQQRGGEADNYISGLTGGANGSGEMGEDDDDDDGDDDVYEEDTAEAERDLAHDETMLAEEMLHMKNEGSQSGSQGNNNAGSHQQQSQQLHQLPLHQDGSSLSYDPSHHHQYLQQGHYPPIPSSTLSGIINPPPMPEPEIHVGTPATPADGEDGSDGDDSQGGGKNRPRGRKPKNQFGAGLQKDSSEYQKLRKENHKNVEKKRRETNNDGIKRLSLLVPGADKNKSKIIAQAAEYIAELKEAEHGYIEKWTLEKLMLEQNLRDLSAQNEDLSRRLADKERRVAQLENGMGMGSMNGNGSNNGGM